MTTAAKLAELERACAAFLAQAGATPTADSTAAAFGRHLAHLDSATLPEAARPVWQTLVSLLLKVSAPKPPIPDRAVAAIASWPSARVGELISAVRAIEKEVARAANDRLIDETNERVSRAYL